MNVNNLTKQVNLKADYEEFKNFIEHITETI